MAIKINLLPREAAPARARAAVRMPRVQLGAAGLATKVATGVFLLVVLGLGALWYQAWTSKAAHEREVTDLKARNEVLDRQLVELRQAEEARLDIQRRLDVIGRVAKTQGVSVGIMNGVLRSVPEGVWLTSFEVKPVEVKVQVPVGGPGQTSEILQRLEQKRLEVAPPAPEGAAAAKPGQTKEVVQIQGYSVLLRGRAFNNFQLVDFMDNLRKAGVFADVNFNVTQAERVADTRVMTFEVTAAVKL